MDEFNVLVVEFGQRAKSSSTTYCFYECSK